MTRVDVAFAAGELSYSKVRAITRVATPETEQNFLDVATHATASQIEKLTGAYRRTRVDPDQPTEDLRRFVRRADTASGMVRMEIQLPPEQANVVWEAMLAALDGGRREDDADASRRQPPVGRLAPRPRRRSELARGGGDDPHSIRAIAERVRSMTAST